MAFTPGNTSLCLVVGAAGGNSSLSELSTCWGCEEQHGVSDQLMGNLSLSTNCTECLENVCSDFVAKQNSNRSQTMVFVAAFIGLLMLLGIPGNIAVLVVYYFKQKKTTANKFMIALASIDLQACLVIHPYIIFKCFSFYYPTTWVCKLFEYLLYVSQSSQALMLTAVAVDRFHAVFKPLSLRYAENAVYMIPACLGMAAFPSIPMILYYGQKTVWLYDPQHEVHIRTHVCHYSDEYDGSRDQFIFVICTLLLMLLIVSVIITLYIMIAWKITRRKVQVGPLGIAMAPRSNDSGSIVNQLSNVKIADNSSTGVQNDQREGRVSETRVSTTTSLNITMHELGTRPTEIDLIPTLDSHAIAHCSSAVLHVDNNLTTITVLPPLQSLNAPVSFPDQVLRIPRTAAVHQAKTKAVGFKGCKLLFIVTAVFFFSWLPFWLLHFLDASIEGWADADLMKAILNHLYFLNNAVNPIVYVFINKQFREECRMTKKKISTRLRYLCC